MICYTTNHGGNDEPAVLSQVTESKPRESEGKYIFKLHSYTSLRSWGNREQAIFGAGVAIFSSRKKIISFFLSFSFHFFPCDPRGNNSRATKPLVKSTRLPSPLSFTVSPPKQQHSRTKFRQMSKFIPSGWTWTPSTLFPSNDFMQKYWGSLSYQTSNLGILDG